MKKIVYFMLAVLICTFFAIPCAAEDSTDVVTEEITEEITEDATDTETEAVTDYGTVTTEQTIITRIAEAWESGDIQDIAVIVWGAVCTIIMFVLKHANTATALRMSSDLKRSSVDTTAKINELVNAQNALESKQTELEELVVEASALVKAVSPDLAEKIADVKIADKENLDELKARISACAQVMVCLAQIMQIVHSNNRNIPQPTKDMVSAVYVQAMNAVKAVNGDDVEG